MMTDKLETQRWIAAHLAEFHAEVGVALQTWASRVEGLAGRREHLQARLARWRSDESTYTAKKAKVAARLERVQALLRRPALHISSIKSLSADRKALEEAAEAVDERLALAAEETARLEAEIAALATQTIVLPDILVRLWAASGEDDDDDTGD